MKENMDAAMEADQLRKYQAKKRMSLHDRIILERNIMRQRRLKNCRGFYIGPGHELELMAASRAVSQ